MCGIAGVVGIGADGHVDAVEAMLGALDHRGPDERRTWSGEGAVVGTARLSIIDPSNGHQPVVDGPERRVIVANGEIYGHRRIRDRFPDHPYASHGDIEVIAPLVRRHGHRFLEHLPGTFALGIWDDRRSELTLARDRFGERPLYWAFASSGRLLCFASEPQALFASGLVSCTVDRAVLAHVIRQGYVPPGRCVWEGMASLPPASVLRWRPGEEPTVQRWWTPPEVEGPAGGTTDPVGWFREELDRAVRDQLIADVPVGTFLSGGLDSSTVSALAARHHPRISGFAFDMPGQSEVPFARAVAERHGIDLHVLQVGDLDLVDLLGDAARVWGEPLADSSTLPTLLLSRFVRGHVKVALTGDGADELLGGYLCWTRDLLHPWDPIRTGAAAPARARSRRWRSRPADTTVARRYADFRSYFTSEELVRLGLPAVSGDDIDLSPYGRGSVDDISRFDLDHYLPGDILVKTDRASMSTGLEVRAPFLDVDVAEGLLRLPACWKVDAVREKLLLRDAFGDLLPSEVLDRPKQGFGSPMSAWLRRPDVVELIASELRAPGAVVGELLDGPTVAELSEGADQRTWTLLAVALWWKEHRSRVAHL